MGVEGPSPAPTREKIAEPRARGTGSPRHLRGSKTSSTSDSRSCSPSARSPSSRTEL
jgi:hypothetical protein